MAVESYSDHNCISQNHYSVVGVFSALGVEGDSGVGERSSDIGVYIVSEGEGSSSGYKPLYNSRNDRSSSRNSRNRSEHESNSNHTSHHTNTNYSSHSGKRVVVGDLRELLTEERGNRNNTNHMTNTHRTCNTNYHHPQYEENEDVFHVDKRQRTDINYNHSPHPPMSPMTQQEGFL